MVVWTLLGCLFLLLIYPLGEPRMALLYQSTWIRDDFLASAIMVVQWMSILFVTFLWLYDRNWNRHDVLFLFRYSPALLYLVKTLINIIISVTLVMFLLDITIVLWISFPQTTVPTDVFRVVAHMIGLVFYYNILAMLCDQLIRHLYGLLIPLVGFLLAFLAIDAGASPSGSGLLMNLTHFLFPVLWYDGDGFKLLYGSVFMVAMSLFLALAGVVQIRKQDAYL